MGILDFRERFSFSRHRDRLQGDGRPVQNCSWHLSTSNRGILLFTDGGLLLDGKALDAVVVRQNYSRLVIDCNRTAGSETSILDVSERTGVPGNIGLSQRHTLARVREIFQPYHDRIVTEIDQLRDAGRPMALISVHTSR